MADLRDEFENPIHHTGAPGAYGTTTGTETHGTHGTTGVHGTAGEHKQGEHHGITGILHRSGSSSSSSSSEDDGHGGRRKKEKKGLKQKLPGEHKDTSTEHHRPEGAHVPGQVGHGTHHEPEKKGIMEKIKEKLPGHSDQGHA